MFNRRPKQGIVSKVKGWLQSPIQYENRLGIETWASYFGKYQNQKWGEFDTDSCWALSAINCAEDQLEWLRKHNQFSEDALNFFNSNGYIDIDGDFSLSERFLEIKGGQYQNGGTSPLAWQLMQKWGCIPRGMLSFTDEGSYFNPSAITPKMELLGQEFRKYVNIAYQSVGKDWNTPNLITMRAALKQAPLCIGIPIPANVFNWNNPFVNYDGGKIPAHEVELYDIDANGQYLIFDQYEPHLKTLSANYYIIFCTQGIVYSLSKPLNAPPSPVLTSDQSYWVKFWSSVLNWINGIPNPFPIG